MKTYLSILTLILIGCSGGLADIRPASLQNAAPSPKSVDKGRAILAQMLEAHGSIERWQTYNFLHAKASDEWFNSLFWTLAAPYSENPEHVVVSSYIHKFPSGRIEFPGGDNQGHTWVVKNQYLMRKTPRAKPKKTNLQDEKLLATFVHNFLLWPNVPFQLATADHVSYVGTSQWEGRSFDRVLIGWGGLEPSSRSDQWELWVNRESKLLERVWFTIRMAGDDAVAGYNLRNFITTQGLTVATRYEGLLDLDDTPLHTYQYRDIEFSHRAIEDLMAVAP